MAVLHSLVEQRRCRVLVRPIASDKRSARHKLQKRLTGSFNHVKLAREITRYFQEVQQRADRAVIQLEWIQRAIDQPLKEAVQADGRIRRWIQVPEMGGKYLRVILLADAETVHNVFFDRSFKP